MALVPPYNTRVIAAQGSVINFTGSAIVNAANEGCISGGGVDGAVSDKGGDALHRARLALPIVRKPSVRCPTGDAKMTIGGELLCEWCIHAVGPNYRYVADDDEGDLLLYMAYHASMREARKKACRTLAFSLLSAGIFRGRRPLRTVLAIGVLAVHAALYEGLSDVFLVGFTHSECETLTSVIDELLVQPDAEDSRKQLLSQLSPQLQELHQRALDDTLDPPPPPPPQIGYMIAAMAATAMHQAKACVPS
jgi:O-acetyl-ADP-ribose deacetylase (regulator of RNase III)